MQYFDTPEEHTVVNELLLSYKTHSLFTNFSFKSLRSSKDVSRLLRRIWNDELNIRESFYLVCFDRAMNVVGYRKISDGGLDSVHVDVRLIFSTALLCKATGIIVAHNHPSGTLFPSSADKQLTERISEAGKLLDINLIEHIILTETSYYSFRDEGDL